MVDAVCTCYVGLSPASGKKGKIDHGIPDFGYPIGGINEKDTSIKFAECIEGRLLNVGVKGVRLALELDYIAAQSAELLRIYAVVAL